MLDRVTRSLALVALTALSLAQTAGAAPAGLVAAYGFDEASGNTAVDASSHGNIGVLSATTARTTSGKYGGALVFNGANTDVTIADSPSLDLTTALTLEAWVYPTTTPTKWTDVVFKPNNIYYLEASSTQSAVPGAGGVNIGGPLYGTAALPVNTWSHLAVTYDGTALILYVNGVQVASRAQSGPILTSTDPLMIGGDPIYGQHFTGRIDEVRVYNRALAPAEIQADRDVAVNAFGAQPPTISISSPTAGGSAVSGVVGVSASLSSTDGVAGVEFFVDAVSIGVDPAPPYLVGWNSTSATNGPHTLTAVARDALGSTVSSPPVVVTSANPAFTNQVVVPGITAADTLLFLPDGRMLVGELTGNVWVVQPGASVKDPTPFLTIDYSLLTGEQGLMDLTLDPAFTQNGHYYVFYTHGSASGNRDRVSRFTASGGGTVPGSELLLWEDNVDAADEHHGGIVAFGPDGKLYISVGDHFNATTSQDLTSYHGKILRINPDGSIPTDNPFYDGGGPNKDEIWAYGLRNPFRGGFDPVSGRFYLGDVGGNDPNTSMEEIDVIQRGANYGWPMCEGKCAVPGTTDPLYAYPHAGRDACAIGGFVYRGTQYPAAEYYGSYFFGDYAQNTLKRAILDPSGNLMGVVNFQPPDGATDTPIGDPVKLVQGPDGSLWYVDIGFDGFHVPNEASIRHIPYTISNQPPVAQATAAPLQGLPPLAVSFSSAGSLDPEGQPITYNWDFGDGATSTQANPTHTYTSAGPYVARLTVSDGLSNALSSDLDITVGNPPTPTILSPANGLVFDAGDVISYSGSATDPEDGNLPPSAFSWTIIFHHANHVHPAAGPITGTTGGTFTIPTSGHDFSGTTSYEIILTVTDSNGLKTSTSVFVYPDKVNVSLGTSPSGLGLDIDGIRVVTPYVKDTVPNFQHTLNAPNQSQPGTSYVFSSWSDGGAGTHPIVVPPGGASYLATFVASADQGLVAAYGFEEGSGTSVLDSSTFGNVGTFGGGTARTTSGKYGSALVFNGTDAVVTIPDSPSLDLTSQMTLEAWVYPTTATARWTDIVYKPNDIYYLEASSTQGGVPAAGGISIGGPLYGTSPLPVNTWTHLAVTYDGVALTLYVNGLQAATRAQSGPILTSSGGLWLGGDPIFGQNFAGLVDEVRVHSRALAANEIQQDMNTPVDPALSDSDGDGVPDGADNCPFVANPAQTNSDAFPAGDACQCGDVDVSGAAGSADVALLRSALAGLPPGLTAAGTNRCPVIAPAGCDVLALSVLRRALAALPPGIAQVCPAQFAP